MREMPEKFHIIVHEPEMVNVCFWYVLVSCPFGTFFLIICPCRLFYISTYREQRNIAKRCARYVPERLRVVEHGSARMEELGKVL